MKASRLPLAVILLCSLASAADPTGSIAGAVLDPSGAAIVGAKIRVTATATGFSRGTESAVDGGYVFPLLPVGVYSISVEAQGFRRFEQRGIEVKANVSSGVPIALQIGATQDTVTVEANAELVDTRSGALRQVVEQRRIIDLPLNGRNAAVLVLLAPGTTDLGAANARGRGDVFQGATYPGAQAITANGARSDGVNYLLDGGSNIDHYTNVNNPFPNPDALEEFSVQTSNYSAEHGRASGAVVNIVTKSGTNQLHGSLFEFLRNGKLNARKFFAPVRDSIKRHQFGGSAGGPIVKDKLFFFGTYQGTQLRNVSAGNTAFVLTERQRAGDFSAVSRQLVEPFTRTPIPGNRFAPSRIDPVTQKFLPLIPVSTAPDGFLLFDRAEIEHENQFMGRIDYQLTKHRIYGRYFYTKLPRDRVAGDLVVAANGREFFNQSVSGSHTYNIRANVLNNFIFSYNRNIFNLGGPVPFSMPEAGVRVAAPSNPEIRVEIPSFFNPRVGGKSTFLRQNYHISNATHWIRGRHEVSFGGDLLLMQVDITNTFRQSGQFRFRGTNLSGHALADFMLGAVERFIQGGGEFAARRGNLGGLFVQDSIRLSRRLHVNLGLRWDPFVPYGDELGRTECFLPGLQSTRFPKAPRGYLYAGDAGCPAGGSQSQWWQLAPRVGFASNFAAHTTLRGGFGIFYQPPFVEAYNNMVNSAPFSPQFILFSVPFGNPFQGIRNPFPAEYAPRNPPADSDIQTPTLGVSYAADWKPSRVMSWNLTLERELGADLLARAAYVASKGTHLGFNTDLNAALFRAGASGGNIQQRRPYQDFQRVTQNIPGGNSIYNSLQLSLEKRFGRGLSVNAHYTFGRSLDWVSFLTDLDGINVVNPFDARAYRGLSDFDVPQRFVMSYVWQAPSPKGHAVVRHLLGNWQTTGGWNWQSGFPLTITSGEDNAFSGVGNDHADVLSRPSLSSGPKGARILKWFSTEAFGTNAPGTFGNAGRNILRGPRSFQVNFAAMKNIPVGERWRFQYRAEFFNFFNNAQLSNPGTTVTGSNYGRITDTADPRIIQMALKLYF